MEDPMNAPELLASDTPAGPTSNFPACAQFDDLDVIAAARTAGCVLFTGPANAKGIALRIHGLSGGRSGPFVAVDCGASEKALERQLFGVLEAASNEGHPESKPDGTVFLYEVGKLSLALQARLADALEPSGPASPQRRSRMRVMASTTASLFDRVLAGTFDDRLFYRLNAIHFVWPPQAES
jgi:DNA-binding NtrC family response regulator